eukprot:gnl/MRDRNA2_/MRDRNA2_128052_c0_seq1.p2 gnl/MRDRNA2_/MRDRNA2_128052_c0~~gnl/MRDRNA2_/MRDRNA2_128052_c0_seq1.p2  ORF type:complete len:449 (-),score=91.60 gnl/MRDRNA2_/MRDRNA2_128052_c0_seq1:91-1437(-)
MVFSEGSLMAIISSLTPHFWEFDWSAIMHVQVIYCSIAITIGGALCACAGIGGGGIIVTALMVCGMLDPYDAVPLSKAVVFFGAMCQLVLNLGKKQATADGQEKDLIDWGIVRIIVPMALTGTLLGVLLNAGTPGWSIVLILSTVLGSMTFMTLQKGLQQREQEQAGIDAPAGGNGHGPQEENSLMGTFFGPSEEERQKMENEQAMKRVSSYVMLFSLLVICIVCGVLRHHMGFCLDGLASGVKSQADAACQHPVLEVFFRDHMEQWLKNNGTAIGYMTTMLALPITICMAISVYFAYDLLNQGWPMNKIIMYQTMALITGLLAALVGIGGGLIFSPFLLVTGVEPAVAVATSATCVIFTSSSTTFQYMLIDRIHMALAIFYGIVNVASSAIGTKMVHYLQAHFAKQRSIITFVVAAAVGISMLMAVYKAVEEFETPQAIKLKTPIQG